MELDYLPLDHSQTVLEHASARYIITKKRVKIRCHSSVIPQQKLITLFDNKGPTQ